MKKLLILTLVLGLLPIVLLAQYQIKIKAIRPADSIAYFRGTVFDDKNYLAKDTIPLYKGNYTIKYTKSIVGGVYYLYFPNSKQKIYFILENKDSLQFELRGAPYLDSVTTNLSKNKILLDYQRLEKALSTVDTMYSVELQQGKKFSAAQKALFFQEKTDQLTSFRQKALKKWKPADALSVYFTALNALDSHVPSYKNIAGRNELLQQINFANPKLLFTPVMKELVMEYLSYYPKRADSICKGIDLIVARVDCKSKAYPYVMDLFSKLLKNRNIPNNTEGYAYFIEKYVQNAPCKFLSPADEKKVVAELALIKGLKLNDTCLNMLLPDTLGLVQNLHTVAKDYDYTVIAFYDPLCEHCQVEVPKMDSMVSLLERQLKRKIGVYAICNTSETPDLDWKRFITEHRLSHQYTHVKIGANISIRNVYDAHSNPVFFLIDRQATMIAKKISPTTLRSILISEIKLVK